MEEALCSRNSYPDVGKMRLPSVSRWNDFVRQMSCTYISASARHTCFSWVTFSIRSAYIAEQVAVMDEPLAASTTGLCSDDLSHIALLSHKTLRYRTRS